MVMFVITTLPSCSSYKINVDPHQYLPDPQNNYEIVLKGNYSDMPTGPNETINPFKNGGVTVSYDEEKNETTVKFYGDPIENCSWPHFGCIPANKKDHTLIVREYWTNDSEESDVPSVSSSYSYDPETQILQVEVINAMEVDSVISEVGYLVFDEEIPLEDMDRETMPPEDFLPSGIPDDTLLNVSQSVSFEIPDVKKTDWIVTYQSVWFEDPPVGGYEDFVGHWTQVSACEAGCSFEPKIQPGVSLFNVKGVIKETHGKSHQNVSYKIDITGGLGIILFGKSTVGTIPEISPGEEVEVKSDFIIGLGVGMDVTMTVDDMNSITAEDAVVFGPIIFVPEEQR